MSLTSASQVVDGLYLGNIRGKSNMNACMNDCGVDSYSRVSPDLNRQHSWTYCLFCRHFNAAHGSIGTNACKWILYLKVSYSVKAVCQRKEIQAAFNIKDGGASCKLRSHLGVAPWPPTSQLTWHLQVSIFSCRDDLSTWWAMHYGSN